MTRQDEEHLSLLRIFYFVFAGLHALGSVSFVVYALFGAAFARFAASMPPPPGQMRAPPMEAFGAIFVLLGVCGMAVMLAIGACQFLVGQRLKERRSFNFVFVCAVLSCLSVPFGLMLGIFTLLVINRPTVKAAFAANDAAVA